MNWIVDNWMILVIFLAIAVCIFLYVKKFILLPTDEQIRAVKEWLLFAVSQAEKELGGGTGKLKLRAVYEQFVEKFSWVAKVVSFETFSVWVDSALIEMRKLLETNTNIQNYIANK